MSVETVEDVLAHFGVKGMKWGVRKRSVPKLSGREPQPVLVKTKPGHPIQTSGGRNQPVAEDAKRAAAIKQKARSSGPQSLSNQEMRALIDRMNLEQQYAKLNPKQKSKAEAFIKGLFKTPIPSVAFQGASKKLAGKSDPRVQIGLNFAEMFLRNHPNQKKFMGSPKKDKD